MKFALICCGNEESYGLLFVGAELKIFGQEIKYFDADRGDDVINEIIDWEPGFICFSPMIAFVDRLMFVCSEIKKKNSKIISCFGGIYIFTNPDIVEEPDVDIVVVGPVRGSIERILDGEKGTIRTKLTTPDDMPFPSREQYYNDISRMRDRYRKFIVSIHGCPWNCSYCNSSSKLRQEVFGNDAFKRYFLHRRPVSTMIEELREINKLGNTYEIQWCDDDVFFGHNNEEWILEFVERWQKEFEFKSYLQTSSHSCLNASDKVLKEVKKVCSCAGMGVEAIRPSSLRIFNRQWDNEDKIKRAYDRLVSFGYAVNMQVIVGLPVEDPVEDALETIMGLQRIGAGSICSIYPLQVYPQTELKKYCDKNGFGFHDTNKKDTNTGVVDIRFDDITTKRLKNICKLGVMFVKYNISEEWMRALIDVDFNDETSRKLSGVRYRECISDRVKDATPNEINEIINNTKLRY